MTESDSEYEEEEFIVFADFKNNLIFNDAEDTSSLIKIIGIDSENPIAEIKGCVFKGKYEYSMGTHVFFEEEENAQVIDPMYEKHAKTTYKYLNKTNKVLQFTRIFVEPESSSSDVNKKVEHIQKFDEENSLRVNITYEEALKQLKPEEN